MSYDDIEHFAAKVPEHRKAEARAIRSAQASSSAPTLPGEEG